MAADFITDIVLPHLIRADAVMFRTPGTGHAQWIAGHILSRRMTRISTRDVVRAYGALKSPESRRDLLDVMGTLVNRRLARTGILRRRRLKSRSVERQSHRAQQVCRARRDGARAAPEGSGGYGSANPTESAACSQTASHVGGLSQMFETPLARLRRFPTPNRLGRADLAVSGVAVNRHLHR